MPLFFSLGFFYLLLLGAAEATFSSPEPGQQDIVCLSSPSLEYIEPFHNLAEGTVDAFRRPQQIPQFSSFQTFGFLSLQENESTNTSLKIAVYGKQGLDARDMIFPFHFFL